MHFFKKSVSWLALFGGVMAFCFTSALAVTITANRAESFNISFINSENPEILKGKVWKKEALPKAKELKLEVFDDQNALILRQNQEIKDKLTNQGYWEIDFDLDLNSILKTKEIVLKAEILDKNKKLIAQNQINKSLLTDQELTEKSLVERLTLKVDEDMVKGGLSFTNNGEDADFKVKTDVYVGYNPRNYVGTFLSKKYTVKKGEKQDLFFVFDKPEPQVYQAEVAVIKGEEEVTGKLIKNFTVKGDFGKFLDAEVTNMKFFEKGDSINVEFSGATTVLDKNLSVEINLTDDKGFSAKKFIDVKTSQDLGNFAGKEVFLATQKVDILKVSLILWDTNKELARYDFATEKAPKPKNLDFVSRLKVFKSKNDITNIDKYKIVGILLVIVVLILLFVRGVSRINKGKNFFVIILGALVISSFFITDQASANSDYFYPKVGQFYSIKSVGFHELGMWGNATDNLGQGLVPTGKLVYQINLLDNKKRSFTLKGDIPSDQNQNPNEYKFSHDLSKTNFSDGEYEITSLILKNGKAGNENTLNIEFKNTFIKIKSKISNFRFNFYSGIGVPRLLEQETWWNRALKFDIKELEKTIYTHNNPLKGNFCDQTGSNNSAYCGNRTHKFYYCDEAGNCMATPKSIGIKFYDPVKPIINDGRISFGGIPYEEGIEISADKAGKFTIKLPALDPSEEKLYVDANPCGNSYFVEGVHGSEKVCLQKRLPCTLSGGFGTGFMTYENGGYSSCVSDDCPTGFAWDTTTGSCVANCFQDKFPYCFNINPIDEGNPDSVPDGGKGDTYLCTVKGDWNKKIKGCPNDDPKYDSTRGYLSGQYVCSVNKPNNSNCKGADNIGMWYKCTKSTNWKAENSSCSLTHDKPYNPKEMYYLDERVCTKTTDFAKNCDGEPRPKTWRCTGKGWSQNGNNCATGIPPYLTTGTYKLNDKVCYRLTPNNNNCNKKPTTHTYLCGNDGKWTQTTGSCDANYSASGSYTSGQTVCHTSTPPANKCAENSNNDICSVVDIPGVTDIASGYDKDHYETRCYNGNVYWYDMCGKIKLSGMQACQNGENCVQMNDANKSLHNTDDNTHPEYGTRGNGNKRYFASCSTGEPVSACGTAAGISTPTAPGEMDPMQRNTEASVPSPELNPNANNYQALVDEVISIIGSQSPTVEREKLCKSGYKVSYVYDGWNKNKDYWYWYCRKESTNEIELCTAPHYEWRVSDWSGCYGVCPIPNSDDPENYPDFQVRDISGILPLPDPRNSSNTGKRKRTVKCCGGFDNCAELESSWVHGYSPEQSTFKFNDILLKCWGNDLRFDVEDNPNFRPDNIIDLQNILGFSLEEGVINMDAKTKKRICQKVVGQDKCSFDENFVISLCEEIGFTSQNCPFSNINDLIKIFGQDKIPDTEKYCDPTMVEASQTHCLK